jgi:hypothetical protein
VVFYGVAAYGLRMRRGQPMPKWVSLPYHFCAMNLAALFGLFRYLSGRQTTLWSKARR